MNKSGFTKPLIGFGWLRVLLFMIVFIILAGVAVGLYFPGLLMDNKNAIGLQDLMKGNRFLMLTGILFILTFVVTYVFRRWVDRKSFISLGFDLNGHVREALAGGMLAVFIICTSSLLLKLTGHLKWMDIIFDPKALFMAFGTVVLVAFYEELIFRGYVLSNLMDSFPKWLALVISSILFMIFHATGSSSIGFFTLANSLLMGLLPGLNYIYTRNLWFPICFHIGWKFLEGPVLGFSNDESLQTLLQTELHGDENFTGGISGLEGSIFLVAVSLLSGLALYLFIQKKFRSQSQPVPGRI
jgi:membrane protease YdiL (CAAX protease family)